jgi:hypothetical protein
MKVTVECPHCGHEFTASAELPKPRDPDGIVYKSVDGLVYCENPKCLKPLFIVLPEQPPGR